MKFLNKLLITIALFVSVNTHSVEISEQDWLALSYALKSEPRDNDNLPDRPKSPKDIMLVSQFIEVLKWQKDFTAKQLHQLNKWRRSDAVLVVLKDAGEAKTVANISAEAKATFLAIQSRAVADEVYEKWQANEFTAADLAGFTGHKGQAVFKTFFNRLPLYLQTGFKDWSVEQLQDSEELRNRDYSAMLAHMASMLGDVEVANFLLQQTASEHTLAFLEQIPEYFSEPEQVTLLKNAANNRKLRSKSFNLLAQHFAKDTSVSILIAEALKDRRDYWQALNLVPAFVKANNSVAFENILKELPESQQQQLRMRLKQKN
ncbi:hypothetical protein [Planctobacterium marinum]|uniref:Uncharacterized protein n=1 Tax=Planctobacterium marinum TaxID=1631968 RepID=A0AA48KVT4_9ALTE|nr:hypothetical protein MACH26_33710 [Planctobacterium marinum]